jgi:PAS domain S-box-containing protein/putative nucleotidyltransferase with HDIG domain
LKMNIKISPSYYLIQGLKYFLITFFAIVILQGILFAVLFLSSSALFSGINVDNVLAAVLMPVIIILAFSLLAACLLTVLSVKRKQQQDVLLIYSRAVNSSSDTIMMHDCNGKTFYSNERTVTSLGLEERQLLNTKFEALLQPECLAVVREQLEKLDNCDIVQYEAVLVRKDKSSLPVDISSHAVKLNGKKYILSVIKDITEQKQKAEELKLSSEKLKNAMEGTINTLALAAEVRDPYTAGHQQRVSILSVAIANELGLSENQKEGIRVASSLHDIGKIYVPAEILSKPGKLKVNEFNLVRDHSEVGYELLKSIEFPWPVADIVLQHHERINGSGYPRGLSGDDIMLESSIIAVSDVVESMASHRPYRPAFHIEKALLEILQNKGTLYHPDVVDTCLKLFNEKGFKF